ncbi:MAG: hypothetical protein AAF721_28555 [Myxococcota bacterium]
MPKAALSSSTLAAAGLRETTSWALRVPALIALLLAVAVFVPALIHEPRSAVWGGAAGGHRGPASSVWLSMFLYLGSGAVLGGLVSRARVHTLMWFNASAAVVAAVVLGTVLCIATWPAPADPLPMAAAVSFLAFNWGFPLALLQMGGALVGRALQRGGRAMLARPAPIS